MAFCSFSKDVDGNTFTSVENKFITNYMPEASGFAVKVYLYGLYLCEKPNVNFSLSSMAEVLKTDEEKIIQAFTFWQDYDLVEILSKEPFTVSYLPVRSAVGKPKKVHYERYGDFNKELQRKMQAVGKFISAGDYRKYMQFLEENAMQPQAFLLVAEYCINKQGDAISPSYIFNKAKKLLRGGCSTYEQVERELSSYNAHEKDVVAILTAMNSYQKTPDESDYTYLRKWMETLGFTLDGIVATAKHLKRGNMQTLETVLEELYERKITGVEEIDSYLTQREVLSSLVFRIARKLGVKVSNPATYIDVYLEKWCNTYGFEESSLLDVALFCLKTERGSFDGMDAVVERLFANGIIQKETVKNFLKEKNDEFKLFAKIQDICGNIRRNTNNLSLIRTWRGWNFTDEMILESAKRSSASSNPIPYMNKILSDWKNQQIFTISAIPETQAGTKPTPKTGHYNPTVDAINAKTDRERYYSLLREKAQIRADKFTQQARKNAEFSAVISELSKLELDLAKAEIFAPDKAQGLQMRKTELLKKRKEILANLGISESDLTAQYTCKKCSDTGFLPNGKACDCYKG